MDERLLAALQDGGFLPEDIRDFHVNRNVHAWSFREFLDRFPPEQGVSPTVTDLMGGPHSSLYLVDGLQWLLFVESLAADAERGHYRSFQEPVPAGTTVRLFLDLESNNPRDVIRDEDVDTIVQHCYREYLHMHELPATFTPQTPIRIRNQRFGERKVHVHFPNLLLQKETLVALVRNVKRMLPSLSRFIDANYAGCRMIFQAKTVTEGEVKRRDHSSMYAPTCLSRDERVLAFIRTRVRAFAWEQAPSLKPAFVIALAPTQSVVVVEEDDDLSNEGRRRLQELLLEYSTDFEATETENGYRLRRLRPSMCPVCHREHQSDNAELTFHNGVIYYRCWGGGGGQRSLKLETIREPTAEDRQRQYEARKARERTRQQLPEFHFVQRVPNVVAPDGVHLRDSLPHVFETGHTVLAVRSSMGTGKTRRLYELVAAHPDKSFLFLTCRRAFATEIEREITQGLNLSVANYLESEIGMADALRVIIQAESLHRIDRVFDYVVMDEATSFLAQFNSGLHRQLALNRASFEFLIGNAQRVIALDADIDERVLVVLHQLRPHDYIGLIDNPAPPRTGYQAISVPYDHNLAQLTPYIEHELRQGHRCHFVLGSVKTGELVAEIVSRYSQNYRFYHGKGDDHREDLADVNVTWKRLDHVLYTSTINAGTNFDQEHFDVTFVIGTPLSNHAREYAQMHLRVRHLKQKRVYYCLQERFERTITDYDQLLRHYGALLKANSEALAESRFVLPLSERSLVRVGNRAEWVLQPDLWTYLTATNELEVNRSKRDLRLMFELRLEGLGYSMYHVTPKDAVPDAVKEAEEMNKALKQMLKEAREALLEDAPTLNESQKARAEARVRQADATSADKLALVKTNLMRLVAPERQAEVTPQMLAVAETNLTTLERLRLMRDMTEASAVARRDVYYEGNKDIPKPLLASYNAIKLILERLGLRSIDDETTEIPDARIKGDMEWWSEKLSKWRLLFNLRSGRFDSFKAVKAAVDTVLKSWCGAYLVIAKKERPREAGQREYVYSYALKHNPDLIGFFRLTKPLEISTFTNVVVEYDC